MSTNSLNMMLMDTYRYLRYGGAKEEYYKPKQFVLSCKVGMLCRFNRDFEEDAINFHFQHIKGPDGKYILQDARQK